MGPAAGKLVTEALKYDGRRVVTVYVPPDPAEAVAFAADGGWHVFHLSEVLEAASTSPTMIVGVHGRPDDDGRLHEYVPGFDVQRFAAHEKFFVDDVGPMGCGALRSRVARRAHWGVGCGPSVGPARATDLVHPDTHTPPPAAAPNIRSRTL